MALNLGPPSGDAARHHELIKGWISDPNVLSILRSTHIAYAHTASTWVNHSERDTYDVYQIGIAMLQHHGLAEAIAERVSELGKCSLDVARKVVTDMRADMIDKMKRLLN